MEKTKKTLNSRGRRFMAIAVIACLIVACMIPLGAFGAEADYTVTFTADGNQTSVGIFAMDKESDSDDTSDKPDSSETGTETTTEENNDDNIDENGQEILKGYLQTDAIPDLKDGWKWQDESNSNLYTKADLLDMIIEKDMSFVAVDTNSPKATVKKEDGKVSEVNELNSDDFIKTNVNWSRTNESAVKTLSSKYGWKLSDVSYLSENMVTGTSNVWDAANHGDTKLNNGKYHYYSGYLPEKTYTPWNAATWTCAHGTKGYPNADMRLFRGTFKLDDGITSVDNFKLDTITGDSKIQINDNMFVFVYPDTENFKLTDSNFTDQLAFWVVGSTASLEATSSIPTDFYGITSDVTKRDHSYRVGDASYVEVPSKGALKSLNDGLYLSDGVYLTVSKNNISTPIKVASEYKNYKNWIIDIYVQDVYGGGGMDQLYVSMSGGNDDPSLILKYWTVGEDGKWSEANVNGQSYYEVAGLSKSDIGKVYSVKSGKDAGQLDMYKPAGYNSGVQNDPEYKIAEGNNIINILYTPEKEETSYNTVQFKAGTNGTIKGDNNKGTFVTGTLWEKTCWTDFDNVPVPEANEGYEFAGWENEDGEYVTKNNDRQYVWPGSIDKDYVFTAVFEPVETEQVPGTTGGDNPGEVVDTTDDNTNDTLNMTTDDDPETALATSTANPAASAVSESTSPVDNILRVLGEIGAPLSGGGNNDITIKDNQVAQSVYSTGAATWALLNLILTILTGIIAIGLIITWFTKSKEDEEERQIRIAEGNDEEIKVKKKPVLRVLSVIMAVLAVILFILTEDMTLPMIFTDNYTIYHVAIFILTVVLAISSMKKYEEPEQDPQTV